MAISNHICNIVRISRYISEYFPVREDFRDESHFLQVNNYVINKNYPLLGEWYRSNAEEISYRVTPWLSAMLLVLQSDQLLPIDLETVRLLVLKTQIDKTWK